MKYCKIQARIVFALLGVFLACFPNSISAVEKGSGYLAGAAFSEDGTPMSGAFVYIFDANRKLPDDGVFWRAPDYIGGQLDRHGRFDIEMPAGDYYLTIIKRASGKVWGPLQEGDVYYLHRVELGEKKMLTIKGGEEIDLGRLKGRRFAGRGVAGSPEQENIASIRGMLVDREGNPISGAYILVYKEPGTLGPPLFSAGPSRVDGSYELKFYEEGTYYLIARFGEKSGQDAENISRPGNLIGVYGKSKQVPLVINKGDVKNGIDIVLVPNMR